MIKSYYLTGFICAAALFATAQEGINFRKLDWSEAMKTSETEGKMIFLEGYADWSQPCEILEQYAFSDREVADFFNEKFINIRLDMEDFPGVLLAEEYGINSFPALLFLDKNGNVIHRGCGAIAADELLALGRTALGDQSLINLDSAFEAGERSNDFLVKYSMMLGAACMETDDLVVKYFSDLPENDWVNQTSWDMINLNVSDPHSAPFQYFMSHSDSYASKYGKDTVDQKIYDVLLDVVIDIYEGADLRLFATQSLQQLMSDLDFRDKNELVSLTSLKVADLKENWPAFAKNAIQVVSEQEVTDPDQLNEFAWKFYLFVDDQEKLEQASGWMKMVLEEYPNATYYDSYASLQFKLGKKKEAIKYAEKALQAAELELEDLMHYENQLKKFSKK